MSAHQRFCDCSRCTQVSAHCPGAAPIAQARVLPIDTLIPVLACPTLALPEALIESARAPLLHLKLVGVHDPPTLTFSGQTLSFESGSMTGQ